MFSARMESDRARAASRCLRREKTDGRPNPWARCGSAGTSSVRPDSRIAIALSFPAASRSACVGTRAQRSAGILAFSESSTESMTRRVSGADGLKPRGASTGPRVTLVPMLAPPGEGEGALDALTGGTLSGDVGTRAAGACASESARAGDTPNSGGEMAPALARGERPASRDDVPAARGTMNVTRSESGDPSRVCVTGRDDGANLDNNSTNSVSVQSTAAANAARRGGEMRTTVGVAATQKGCRIRA